MLDKTEKRIIQFKFYHNSKSQPIITKCMIKESNGDMATGIAICSNLDPFNGKIGKKIALGRAFKALKNRSNCSKVLRPGIRTKIYPYINIGYYDYYKCQFIPAIY